MKLVDVQEDSNLEKYIKKQKENPYINKGQLTVDTNGFDIYTMGMIQNINCLFEGKNNKPEKKIEQQILINSEDNSTITFRQDNQKVAIKTEMLGSKFVAIENENLKALVERFGFNSETIPNKIELKNYATVEKEMEMLKKKYLKKLNQHLTKEQFSKEEIEGQTVLTLRMTEQKTVDLLKDILQQIRNEEINEQLKTEIDAILTKLSTLEINPNNNFIINLYVKSNDVKKYEIIFEEEEKQLTKTTIENTDNQIIIKTYQDTNLVLEGNLLKQIKQKDVNYDFLIKAYIEGQKTEFVVKAQYRNLLELNNVDEMYEIRISYEDQNQYGNLENTSDNMDINVNYLNKKIFDSNVEIDGVNQENSIILNSATNKELNSILKSIFKNIDLF